MKNCKTCNAFIAKSAKVCPSCGAKQKNPLTKLWIIAASVIIIIAVVALSSGEDEVQNDILNYVNEEISDISDIQDKVYEAYENARENSEDDAEFYDMLLEDVIPSSQELIDDAESISPETPEVQEIHEFYISAVNEQHNGFTMLLAAIENYDTAQIAEANEKLNSARKNMRTYDKKLDALAKEHGVEITDAD